LAQGGKKLANQSASATDKIAQQIGRVQTATTDVVGSLDSIASSMANVATSTSSLVGTTEQQTANSG